ncbi:hypothetical protein LOAG_12926 [Loa loa]|uniref:Uncharacterized protein n=1 Tax=Loa loa TaxID=7209 RepID=A0A1S0TKF4_LOALO|nr:hypothetical protein LOAG_12926 [Loa loa]EFO15584.2 hypothetical protein LOAG_12926 [Loa loa]
MTITTAETTITATTVTTTTATTTVTIKIITIITITITVITITGKNREKLGLRNSWRKSQIVEQFAKEDIGCRTIREGRGLENSSRKS